MKAADAGRQVIPRPPGTRPGGPAPWAELPGERRRGISLARVEEAMRRVGTAEPWPHVPKGTPGAAVLVPLFEEDGEARVILTRRGAWMRSHSGQISFPGGKLEPGEAPLAAALREAAEEIGIDPATVEILGQLGPLSTISQNAAVTPFVGTFASRPELRPNPDEVDLAFDVALADLVADGVFREERWDVPPIPDRAVYFFEAEVDTIWGMTARILHELLELVTVHPPDA